MSTIKFKNYDSAYTQTAKIYRSIQTDGAEMVRDLKKLCDSLKEKWVADDAPMHINNLVNIQNSLREYFVDSVAMIVEVSDRVVDIQTAVHEISDYNNVGVNLKNQFARFLKY